ncbi:hypothetical protein ACLKA6_016564 [Drosophila palustris]
MDQFDVPKAINRHVYKALIYLQSGEPAFLTEDVIGEQVKRQWRRNKPRPNMDEAIHKSLSNLTDLGILACTGSSSYAVRHTIKDVGQSNNTPVVQLEPKTNSTKPRRGNDKKKRLSGVSKRGSITKSKRIKLQSFPNLDTFVMCNECIPVMGRFSDAYGDLKAKRFGLKLIPAGANSPLNPIECRPPGVSSVEATADVEMEE